MTRFAKPCANEGCSYVATHQGICQNCEIDRVYDMVRASLNITNDGHFDEDEAKAVRDFIRSKLREGRQVMTFDVQIFLGIVDTDKQLS
jgi:hypothetical protein